MGPITINMNKDDAIVFKDSQHRLRIEMSPELRDNHGEYEASDWRFTELFSWLNPFYYDISEIRRRNRIKIISYPDKPTVEQLVGAIGEATGEHFAQIVNEAEELRSKYKMTENWYLSFISAVVTHTILIPMKQTVGFHMSFSDEETPGGSVSVTSETKRIEAAMQVVKYPGIYFPHKISIDELKKWINRNKDLLHMMMQNLPEKLVTKRAHETIFWGQMAWILRQAGITSWVGISDQIQRIVDKDEEEGRPVGGAFATVPGPEELEKYYNRFLESLHAMSPRQ